MKQFGIRGRLPPGDPMRAPHLLGEDWEWTRWFDSERERDEAYAQLSGPFIYYRNGDRPSVLLSKIEREG